MSQSEKKNVYYFKLFLHVRLKFETIKNIQGVSENDIISLSSNMTNSRSKTIKF